MNNLFFSIMLVTAFSFSHVESALVDSATEKEFPSQVSVNEQGQEIMLDATGVATRKKFFVKVYSVAHYMQDPVKGNLEEVLAEVFDNGKAKQLTTHWVRNVDSKTVKKGYRDAFNKVLSPDEVSAKSDQIDQFIGFFDQDANVDDIHVIRWLPGGIIQVEVNGEDKGQIQDDNFAKDVWSIWLGPNSVVPRNQLVSEITN